MTDNISRNNNNNNNNMSSIGYAGGTSSMNSQEQQECERFAGEHVLKIYKNDQYFKFLVVHKVMFDIFGENYSWGLYENGILKGL